MTAEQTIETGIVPIIIGRDDRCYQVDFGGKVVNLTIIELQILEVLRGKEDGLPIDVLFGRLFPKGCGRTPQMGLLKKRLIGFQENLSSAGFGPDDILIIQKSGPRNKISNIALTNPNIPPFFGEETI